MSVNWRWVWAVALGLFGLSLFYLSHVYVPLTIAFVLAYLLEPVVGWLDSRGFRRSIGIPVVLVLFFVFLCLTGMAIVPKIIEQGRELLARLPLVYEGVRGALGPISQDYLGYNVFVDFDKVVASIGDPGALVKPLGGFVGGVFAHTFKFITTVLGLLIIPLMVFYLLREFPFLYDDFLYVVPARHHALLSQVRDRLGGVLGGFIRGQLVVSSILSFYYGTAFAMLRLELALVLGLMAGFFNIVPYLGISSVLTLTLLIAFIHGAGASTFVGIAVVFAIGMGAEGSFLTPRIVGRKVGLSPLMLILALLVGGELAGLVGMLLAVPIAAIAKVLLGVVLERYRASETFNRLV